MNIGVDIDGVLTNLERMILDYGTKRCVDENLPIELDLSKYDLEKAFNWTAEQEEKFWNIYFVQYVKQSEPRAFAPEIIKNIGQAALHRINNVEYIINSKLKPVIKGI